MSSVTARAPAKVNLALRVGPLGDDGFHPVATVYQAVSVHDEVTVSPASGLTIEVSGATAAEVPVDATNLAARAATLLAARLSRPPDVRITIRKSIPVAGGMAGGSADAAATLVACDALWGSDLGRDELLAVAAELGSDVPFSLVGGTALGTGRGDRLTTVLTRGQAHWVFALSTEGLSTPAVYGRLDGLRAGQLVSPPSVDTDTDVVAALAAGDLAALGAALSNDLQPAALALRPGLRPTLDAGRAAGALGAIVSGSGPTCAFLARDAEHALDLAVMISSAGTCASVVRAQGPVGGAALVH